MNSNSDINNGNATVTLLFDGPHYSKTSNRFTHLGSSPRLLKGLLKYLKREASNIDEIFVCLYLFNNYYLHENFRILTERYGIKINVISIPLKGYDNKSPADIVDANNNLTLLDQQTKYDLANRIYTEFIELKVPPSYKLFIFSHIYLRSHKVKKFSRGSTPYSLHAKSMYVKYKNDKGAVLLSSSNLAVRDSVKNELLLRVENDSDFIPQAIEFFNHLLKHSIDVSKYDEVHCDNKVDVAMDSYNYDSSNFYTAPFYRNSSEKSEDILIEIINKTKNRLYVSAQHISAFNYNYPEKFKLGNQSNAVIRKPGILKLILDLPETVKVSFLSQTFVDEKGNSQGCREPINKYSFSNFIDALKRRNGTRYFVNENIHWKFIVSDDTCIFTTCNFTPTQFIYLEHVNIDNFDEMPGIKFRGIHAEVGQYLILTNKEVADQLINEFDICANDKNTYSVKLTN